MPLAHGLSVTLIVPTGGGLVTVPDATQIAAPNVAAIVPLEDTLPTAAAVQLSSVTAIWPTVETVPLLAAVQGCRVAAMVPVTAGP
jgi:hypothetical protein